MYTICIQIFQVSSTSGGSLEFWYISQRDQTLDLEETNLLGNVFHGLLNDLIVLKDFEIYCITDWGGIIGDVSPIK